MADKNNKNESPGLSALAGMRLAVGRTGMKYKGRDDILLAVFDSGSSVAGVFTQSKLPGAPVKWCRRHIGGGAARALIVNAGCANAFTGAQGDLDVEATCQAVSKEIGCGAEEIFAASTGVIGEFMDMKKIYKAVAEMSVALGDDNWQTAAAAITTTDTYAKTATLKIKIGAQQITINAIAKGSGMIAPNMATLLAFVFTDAKIAPLELQKLLSAANDNSFNAISVDTDTSTSDMCLAFATGAGAELKCDEDLGIFADGLQEVMRDLAVQVVRDGEGAQKLICVTVSGAYDDVEAKIVARAVCDSPLVKTAIAGEDANWGRIAMAVGKSGARIDANKLCIAIGDTDITADGCVRDDFNESQVAEYLTGGEIVIKIDLQLGGGSATFWGCDLTHGYIDINADYRS